MLQPCNNLGSEVCFWAGLLYSTWSKLEYVIFNAFLKYFDGFFTYILLSRSLFSPVSSSSSRELDQREISMWLTGIGLSDYIPNIVSHGITGPGLLVLRNEDMAVSAATCVMYMYIINYM